MTKTKKYIVSEQILVCYEVEASNTQEAREKYSSLTTKGFNGLVQDAVAGSWGEVNVEEAGE